MITSKLSLVSDKCITRLINVFDRSFASLTMWAAHCITDFLEGLRVADGSGLSYENRISPRQLVAALRAAARSFRFGPEFLASLPIAARDGTLEERVEAAPGRLRAKTGLLTRVTGLSGLAEQEDGTVLLFALLVNGYRGSAEAAMRAVDGFASSLTAASVGERRSAADDAEVPGAAEGGVGEG